MTGGSPASAPAQAPARVRVIRLLRVREGREEDFVRSYGDVLAGAARFPGHLGEQLCRSLDDPDRWLLTSEWDSLEAVHRWRSDAEHRTLVEPMNACLHDDRWTGVFRVTDTGPREPAATGAAGPDRRARRG